MSADVCKETFETIEDVVAKAKKYLTEGNAYEYEHWIFRLNGQVRGALTEAVVWADEVEKGERRNRTAQKEVK